MARRRHRAYKPAKGALLPAVLKAVGDQQSGGGFGAVSKGTKLTRRRPNKLLDSTLHAGLRARSGAKQAWVSIPRLLPCARRRVLRFLGNLARLRRASRSSPGSARHASARLHTKRLGSERLAPRPKPTALRQSTAGLQVGPSFAGGQPWYTRPRAPLAYTKGAAQRQGCAVALWHALRSTGSKRAPTGRARRVKPYPVNGCARRAGSSRAPESFSAYRSGLGAPTCQGRRQGQGSASNIAQGICSLGPRQFWRIGSSKCPCQAYPGSKARWRRARHPRQSLAWIPLVFGMLWRRFSPALRRWAIAGTIALPLGQRAVLGWHHALTQSAARIEALRTAAGSFSSCIPPRVPCLADPDSRCALAPRLPSGAPRASV